MPNIQFSICAPCDCSGIRFSDLTGQAPGVSGGYDVGAAVNAYSGLLRFRDLAGALVATYPVQPNADPAAIPQQIFWDQTGVSVGDGIWEVEYEVKSGATVIGSQKMHYMNICELECSMSNLIATATPQDGLYSDDQRLIDKATSAMFNIWAIVARFNRGDWAGAQTLVEFAKLNIA